MNLGRFLSIFIFSSLIVVVVINWSTVQGIFNYKAIYGGLFNSHKEETAIKIPDVALSEPEVEEKFVDKPDSIEIPKIEITAPLVFIDTDEKNAFNEALKNGVVHYYKSPLPGEKGNTVILGHSAPSGWPKRYYEWVFSRLNELEAGDDIFVYYKNREYQYKVTSKYFLKPGEEVPNSDLTNSEYILSLISCWPPGQNIKRIIIQGQKQ
ncbi:MAG: sortase [Candidatus Paceibacterota bacterium]